MPKSTPKSTPSSTVDDPVGAWLKAKALELIVAAAAVVAVGYISLNFVSAQVYAEDQKSIVAAIQNIVPNLKRELDVERIQREIKENDELRQRLTRYKNADPESSLNTAREEEIEALKNAKEQLQTQLNIATNNRDHPSTL